VENLDPEAVLKEALDQRQRLAVLARELRSRAIVQEAGAKQRAACGKDPDAWRTSDVVRLTNEIADRIDCITNGAAWNPRRPVVAADSPVFETKRRPQERMERSRVDKEEKERPE
jgi:hypothetical protein